MFPFQQNNEFSSQISSNPHQDIAEDNPILGGTSNLSNFMVDGQPPLILANSNTNNEVNYTCDEKKIIRKEIERQRRQQMSTLHGSLRSLLPLESLKGKRSMSDHLNAAAKYIKNLQNNVQELSVKRDMLKNLSDSSTSLDDQGTEISSQNNFMNTIVTVRSHVGGVEIGVSCGSGENSFPLSRVLEAVVEEGFDVVSCISTKRDGRLYSTIQCQASHLTCIDVAELQQKLNDVILS
ncbi:transcription factor bHLH120-like isoform X1 [Hevea brasiliensis]|uniref:transcription factor bHLH120-like isoform X1 n=1 Tax=Hevea brasiliensis TaxID=3981 RepID=UPI0025F173DD|nr:transcription factor bHLH120-like isoform X1 [Hevea brasiliensis]